MARYRKGTTIDVFYEGDRGIMRRDDKSFERFIVEHECDQRFTFLFGFFFLIDRLHVAHSCAKSCVIQRGISSVIPVNEILRGNINIEGKY